VSTSIADIRSLEPLWRLRQRRHAVVVCGRDPEQFHALTGELEELGADLVLEPGAGPLGEALGRPSVTVADRFGTVGLHARTAEPRQVLATLESFALACPECGPQAWGDPGA
jgi:hypothetical protein